MSAAAISHTTASLQPSAAPVLPKPAARLQPVLFPLQEYEKLSSHLIGAIRKQMPVIQHNISEGIISLEKELESLGGPGAATRGSMIHLVLQLCRTFEEAFAKVDVST